MDGILLFDKPILWTSHDAVDFIRRKVGQKAVGHAGTLDPLATGLLVILLGKATKLSQLLSASDKQYAGSMTLGFSTDTQDMEGRIISSSDSAIPHRNRVEEVFSEMTGPQLQSPPLYSAAKKNGKTLYAWARKGVNVAVDAREIMVSQLSVTDIHFPEIYFCMDCSKGTYVRSTCNRIGQLLGCGATLSSLVRLRSGSFYLKDALNETRIKELTSSQLEKYLITEPHESLQRV